MSKPVPLPLVAPIGARYQSLAVDSRLVNAFAEKPEGQGSVEVYKRPGVLSRSTAIPAGTARGTYNWLGDIYAIVGAAIYKNGVSLGAVAAAGVYYFTACLGATPKLFFHNDNNAYTVTTTGTLAAVSDVNYPPNQTPAIPTVGGAVFLDGTIYVMDASATIYGSTAAGNDPTTWDPLNKIVAQLEPDAGAFLAKQLVYVLALKNHYAEAFYDAGNATGSPLAAVSGSKMNFGTRDRRTVVDCGGDILFVSATKEGSVQVAMVSGLHLALVSTPPIERILEAADYTTIYAWCARIEGHRFYAVTSTVSNFTLVYDLTSGLWYQWTDPNGNYFPYAFSTLDTNNKALLLHETSGATFNLDIGTYQDNGVTFLTLIYTPNFFGQAMETKSLGRMDIQGDMVPGSTLSMQYSDDDYATFSSIQTCDMSLPRPMFSDLGEFTRRAFLFSHRVPTAFRIERVVMWLEQGS